MNHQHIIDNEGKHQDKYNLRKKKLKKESYSDVAAPPHPAANGGLKEATLPPHFLHLKSQKLRRLQDKVRRTALALKVVFVWQNNAHRDVKKTLFILPEVLGEKSQPFSQLSDFLLRTGRPTRTLMASIVFWWTCTRWVSSLIPYYSPQPCPLSSGLHPHSALILFCLQRTKSEFCFFIYPVTSLHLFKASSF